MPRLSTPRKQLLDVLMRDTIYEAAVSVLTEYGVERTTMDRVAAAANVGKGSLYNYFQSKEELLQFVYEKTVLPILESLQEIVDADPPAPEKLQQYLHAVLEHSARHVRVFSLLLKNDAVQILVQSSQRSARAMAISQLAAIFRRGIEQGLFRSFDPVRLAALFLGSCTALLNDYLDRGAQGGSKAFIELIMKTFLNGISLHPLAAATPATQGPQRGPRPE
jgi:AcrR family transcriptional regulator